jgi:hypothetical protein
MSQQIVAHFTKNGVPVVSPANAPTIRIRRIDTGALVVTDAAMTELGDGSFAYTFTPTDLLEYSIRADGDPTASGQTTVQERYAYGSLGTDIVRKVLLNKAVTTPDSPTPGAKRVDFFDDDQSTIIESITISADGNTRTNP